MSKNVFLFFFALLILSGCTNQDSQEKIDYHLENINRIRVNQAFSKRVYSSIFILEELTGLSSSASFGDISIYTSKDSIDHDLQMWNQWKLDHNQEFSIEDSINTIEKDILSTVDWLAD